MTNADRKPTPLSQAALTDADLAKALQEPDTKLSTWSLMTANEREAARQGARAQLDKVMAAVVTCPRCEDGVISDGTFLWGCNLCGGHGNLDIIGSVKGTGKVSLGEIWRRSHDAKT